MASMAGSGGATGTAGAGQSQPTDDQADQPHHGGHEGPGSPIGDADSAVGEINPERMLFIFITQVSLPTLSRRKATVVFDKIDLT
jgi:hypothetical protein